MKTKCMSCGGSMKKMQKGGSIKKKPLLPAPKSKTGMDALKALGKYASTFGFATEGYNPAPSKKAKKTTPKMAVGGTTTKRIIKKSTGGMYGIPQENLGTSGQYGFAKKGGATKAAKFAALAPPYDKATFADKIVGAKKSVGSKKLPKAQFGAFIKAFSKVVKPVTKIVKPASKIVKPVAKRVATTSKKNIPKKIDFRNTKNSMERMMGSKQIQNYFKKSTQRDNLLNLVNKNKN